MLIPRSVRLSITGLCLCATTAPLRSEPPIDDPRAAMIARAEADMAAFPRTRSSDSWRRVKAAAATVPRERFVPPDLVAQAYRPTALPIDGGQTISDPRIVMLMIAAVRAGPTSHVLEVGTGSGYGAAMLSRVAAEVWSIEILLDLARQAAERIAALGYANVHVRSGDGYAGWPEAAPFDAIVVTAGAAAVPPALLAQLKPGGRLIMPIGPDWPLEQLVLYTKRQDGGVDRCSCGATSFVPLTGQGARPARSYGLSEKIKACR